MAGLVACKTCSKEIAKGVKKCPHCGKDQRNWFMRHKIMTFIGTMIILFIIGGALGGDDEETVTTSGGSTASVKKETVYKVGDILNIDQLEVTVSKTEDMDKIGDPSFLGKKASDGGTLVAIQYTMKNISEEPVGMFDYPTIKLVDEKGTEYDSDIDASGAYAAETGIDDSKFLSDLNPDISVTGTSAYEVSKERFANGKWYIQIGDAKVQIK